MDEKYIEEIKRRSDVINDSLWYVDPKDICAALREAYDEGRRAKGSSFREGYQTGRRESYEEVEKIIPYASAPFGVCKSADCRDCGRSEGWNSCRADIIDSLDTLKEKL